MMITVLDRKSVQGPKKGSEDNSQTLNPVDPGGHGFGGERVHQRCEKFTETHPAGLHYGGKVWGWYRRIAAISERL